MTLSAQDRARRIKIILFDVDGVLTDGNIWIIPVPVAAPDGAITTKMVEAKGYSAHDGAGITLARLGGMKLGIITKRIRETVALRARDLKLEFVYQGQAFKMQAGARDHGEGRRDAGRDRLCGRRRDRPAGDAPVRTGRGRGQCAGAGEGRGALCDSATAAARARGAMRSSSSSKPRACWSSASRPPSTRAIRSRPRWISAKAERT